MSAETETIVRALADSPEPIYGDVGEAICRLCEWAGSSFSSAPLEHLPSCPWRLAREWAAAHPVLEPVRSEFVDETGWQRIEHPFDTDTPIVSMFDPDGLPLFGDMVEIESRSAVVVRITRPCVVQVSA